MKVASVKRNQRERLKELRRIFRASIRQNLFDFRCPQDPASNRVLTAGLIENAAALD
jgi:hypothetical protein